MIDTVGMCPGGRGVRRLPREKRDLVKKHRHVIKAGMPYWGTLNPILPQTVRIADLVWQIYV